MKKFTPYFLILIILLAAGGFAYYKIRLQPKPGGYFGGGASQDASAQTAGSDAGSQNLQPTVYTDPAYGFTVTLPKGLKAVNFDQGEGYVVLITETSPGAGGVHGAGGAFLQVYVRPFEEDTLLTAARIKRDLPGLNMQNVAAVVADGTPAVAFYSQDGSENLRQVWFVKDKNLYQIIADPADDNLTGAVMESWKWE